MYIHIKTNVFFSSFLFHVFRLWMHGHRSLTYFTFDIYIYINVNVFDCIDIICALSTLALVFKKTKKKRKKCSTIGWHLTGWAGLERGGYFDLVFCSFSVCNRCLVCVCVKACNFVLVLRLFFNTQDTMLWLDKKGSYCVDDGTVILGCSLPHMDQWMIHDCNYEQFKLTHVFI